MTLKFNFKSAALYLLYALLTTLINLAFPAAPLGIGAYFAMLVCGTNIAITPIIFVLSSAVFVNIKTSVIYLAQGVFLCLITLIYRKTKKRIRYEGLAYLLLALSPYIAFADWTGGELPYIDNPYALKSIAAAAVMLFAFFSFKTVYSMLFRLLKCRLKEDELISVAVVYTAVGTGIYNLAGVYVYVAVAAGIIILFTRLLKSPSSLICALALALPPALINLSFEYMTSFIICAAVALLFVRAGRFAPSAVCLPLTAGYLYLKGGYDCAVYLIVLRALLLFITCMLPCVFSNGYLEKLRLRLKAEDVLQSVAVDRLRRRTGEKLYRISEVFREIECAFTSLDDDINEVRLRSRMLEELKEKCCKNCDFTQKCPKKEAHAGFKKLVDAGCVRGKVNLIDLPSEITVNCSCPAEVLDRLNLLLAEYRRYMTEVENAKNGRILLADQAKGVAEVMKNCAVEMSRSSSLTDGLTKRLLKALAEQGIVCPEMYVDGESGEIFATVYENGNVRAIAEIITRTAGRKYILKDRLDYDGQKSCLVFCAPPRLDAVFGVAYAIKAGESVSGDTHSVIKINEHSFLMALSDGMGSGEYAKRVSATAISLIEAFYRAEMPEDTVLKTINKLLSFNRDERFTCIDIGAVNLETGAASFVKIGSPAGIILRENELKVLESQSLPLGILENIHPTVCSERLKAGDMIIFMSDGITSSFPSSTELYEFLQTLRPLNPQNLADTLLKRAKELGDLSDDMTVLCTRVIEK